MSAVTLAAELALLSYDDAAGTNRLGTPKLDYGLAGAVLLELALAGRLAVTDGKVSVVDPAPVGSPLLDEALGRIAADDRRRRPKDWIVRLSKGLRERVLDGLVADGVLRRDAGRVLGIVPRTRYPSPTGAEPPVEADARQRLVGAVGGEGAVAPGTAALLALVRAVGLDRRLFRDLPRDRVKRRLKEIDEGAWAPAAVKRALDELHVALMAMASTSAIVATTTGS
ncbi:GOLPH3/VPS74 family protein [Micromonospora auratinigra]|uniref:Golgi phosphoprotein 3 (GPP34) n=1 Tax=Micromonospora auratinigra TaxID=261654 RepID=A0A1A9A1F6_9ACTN|nr:GPP34 family phosphoprotein [Micromonospora auratinigra]SBT49981.1 Golgi phosphoprotein 3 (GPP34) [Micromonospora auratinigra]